MGKTSLARAELAVLVAACNELEALPWLLQVKALPRVVRLLLALLGRLVDELERQKGVDHIQVQNDKHG